MQRSYVTVKLNTGRSRKLCPLQDCGAHLGLTCIHSNPKWVHETKSLWAGESADESDYTWENQFHIYICTWLSSQLRCSVCVCACWLISAITLQFTWMDSTLGLVTTPAFQSRKETCLTPQSSLRKPCTSAIYSVADLRRDLQKLLGRRFFTSSGGLLGKVFN